MGAWSRIQVLILILEIGQATSWKQIRRAMEELLNYFNFEKEDLQRNEAFSTMVRKAVEMAKNIIVRELLWKRQPAGFTFRKSI